MENTPGAAQSSRSAGCCVLMCTQLPALCSVTLSLCLPDLLLHHAGYLGPHDVCETLQPLLERTTTWPKPLGAPAPHTSGMEIKH